jgi:hypothetical protein
MTGQKKTKQANTPAQQVQSKRAKKRANAAKRQDSQAMGNQGAMSTVGVAQGKVKKTGKPKMQTLRNGDCHIVHREYIQDLTAQGSSPSTFNVAATLSCNPGQAGTFPWLSKIAANFESYKFNKLKFCYETEAPSSLGGTQVLAVDYDASDAAPLTKQQALAYRGSVRSPPWQNCCHTSIKEDLSKEKTYYVRPGAQPANTDIKTYDVGVLYAINQGVTTGGAVTGELYVEYDVTLMTPLYEPAATSGLMTAAAGTVASPLLAGVATGSIALSQALTVVTMTGLIIGQEYVAIYLDANAVTVTYGTFVGLTQKTYLGEGNGGVDVGFTFTPTASTASFAITAGGAPGASQLVVTALTGAAI